MGASPSNTDERNVQERRRRTIRACGAALLCDGAVPSDLQNTNFPISQALRCVRGSRLRQRTRSLLRRNLRHSRSDWSRIRRESLRLGAAQCATSAPKESTGCSRAEEFDFTRGNLFYLFNPFGPATMKRVLDGLREGISARTRVVTVIYVNPVHEDLLAGTPWLRCYARLPDPDLSEFRATSLWISY